MTEVSDVLYLLEMSIKDNVYATTKNNSLQPTDDNQCNSNTLKSAMPVNKLILHKTYTNANIMQKVYKVKQIYKQLFKEELKQQLLLNAYKF